MSEQTKYGMRKQINELKNTLEAVRKDRNDFRDAVESIFNSAASCEINQSLAPLGVISKLRKLVLRIRKY